MTEPKISIIVPVYNTEKYLVKCLESLIHQTFENIEIVCINDGSTDASLEILKNYESMDKRIRIIDQNNKGLSETRNVGVKNASANYVMFLDSDDWIDLNTCKIAYKTVTEYKADIVMWSYIREFETKSLSKKIFDKNDEFLVFEGKEARMIQRRMVGLIDTELKIPENIDALVTAWGKIYRKDIIIKNNVKFIDTKEIGTEDALFNLHVFGHAGKIVFINEYFNHYRKDNVQSLTSNYKESLYGQWENLFSYMESYIKENDLDTTFQQALDNRIALSVVGLGLNIMQSKTSEINKVREIKQIISSPKRRKVYKQLTLKYFPLHWKIFYGCAKYKCAVGVYLLLMCIRKVIGN